MVIKKIQLPYSPNAAIDYFTPLAHLPWAMLLHSGNAKHLHNRFDIIVADPIATLTTYQLKTTITEQNHASLVSESDPFKLLQGLLDKYQPKRQEETECPFNGGALGLWSYDLGRRIEKLPEISTAELQFPDMAVGIYLWALIVDHHDKTTTLISYDDADARLAWLNNQKRPRKNKFQLTSAWQSNMSEEAYHHNIARIHEYLRNGDCYQINLAQRFKAKYKGDEWNAFLALLDRNGAPFSSFIRLPENAVISISPERFIFLQDGDIQTRPIKGTLPRLDNEQDDLAQVAKLSNSVKDRAENLMIVDLLRNDIGRVAKPGTVSVPELFAVEAFPAVHHLVSTVTAKLDSQYRATDLLRACFPGGSITGAPKVRAMEIIEELEPHRRHGYCGAIGYISFNGNMDSNITIRTLLTYKKQVYCWAGGGIVADSQADKEYQETFDKLSLILPLLGALNNDD
ncbi:MULTISPECIES: aminodeoxychorismate synthase component 1 [Providencia]|uniref:Aminodeoxychorismate synthase component 1 n=1 Tax=Providencia rettgeri TaxID=587 RepID=A0AB35L5Z3_PRORE|nr:MULTISPECIES: aminodeoxychorismate synthase component 1 [Providencia]EHZ7765518.1 aminodeoxychorismate synthase component 1 [Providencia rettgeri]EIJ7168660.1 aminodeoxychorismate synthase component 1 [Providencia rettgeri]EJD6047337.1 aminodeoxychorismate synthase component 1 [Providencia rettgeri]EJD6474553.1 aminodeoxychorismate synthase component 1 [Providencia rettgeri]ELH9582769.1 aminodeoxychorismate synthase component 1 [Providencia rettgeri]